MIRLLRRGKSYRVFAYLAKKRGNHMKDCVEFLKWMHKKGIAFRE
jgi:hypothetical protein